VIVDKPGKPCVAVVNLDDFALLDRLRRDERASEFSRLAARAAQEVAGPGPSEEEIVRGVARLVPAA
jgi:hypothetical protein